MTKLLIDADISIFQAAFANEVAEEDTEGYWTWKCDIGRVKDDIYWSINNAMEVTGTDSYSLCLSDDKNFRKKILPTYKEKRKRVKRPIVLRPIREWLLSDLGAITFPELEGDDVIGILHTKDLEDTLVYSKDKDMQTIYGKLYRKGKIEEITKEEAKRFHFVQTLTGDTTDGYSGLAGCGPAKANKILGEKPSWGSVVKAYEEAGKTEEDALIQARVAKILDSSLWSFETQTYKLWEPIVNE